jgi:hypothetical protein
MKYIKTEAGQRAFKERSTALSSRQRTAFIMFDGNKTVEQVLEATSGMGVNPSDVDHMVAHGFLTPAPGQALLAEAQAAQQTAQQAAVDAFSARSAQDRYKEAKPLATQLTAKLGLRGFLLNLSVESASGFEALLVLLPKIKEAAGPQACQELERALKG